jgi:hypothetical protein
MHGTTVLCAASLIFGLVRAGVKAILIPLDTLIVDIDRTCFFLFSDKPYREAP